MDMNNSNNEHNVILKVKHCNFGLMGPGSWSHTDYTLYSDGNLESLVTYQSSTGYGKEGTKKSFTYNVSSDDINEILNSLEESKAYRDIVRACDGSAYEFTLYEDNKEIYKRDLGYIYGIEPLEKIADIINKYESKNDNN